MNLILNFALDDDYINIFFQVRSALFMENMLFLL